jgi:uncharacterized protein YndB with AHSA1/START domain
VTDRTISLGHLRGGRYSGKVWDAIATADGISAWMVPTRLDPQIGGEVSFDLGDFRSTGVVTDYTP